jgi:hypothetical protein
VRVIQQLRDHRFRRVNRVAGESRGMAGFGGSGAVSFDFLAGAAMVYAPEDANRSSVIEAVGRGIGRTAVHEFTHQLLPRAAIHASRDARSYEHESAARAEQYFGDLHWDVARPWLEARIGMKQGSHEF